MYILPVAVLAALMVASPAGAQSLELVGTEFNETLRDSAEISGAVVVGAQMHWKRPQDMGFAALLPKLEADEPVCIRVVTANGLYDAENPYTYNPGDGGTGAGDPMSEVVYPTEHDAFLAELSGYEITASIARGDCDTRSDTLMVANWAEERASNVTLLINSFRADAVFVQLLDSGGSVRCEPVEIEVRSAYDTICDLPVGGETGELDLLIHRMINRQPAPETAITLFLPAG
ncbi:MAG: hypothetical protein QNJ13_06055 [Paracoccaceae bacterium]|nr:hypothetical protein [Paracoccaceae bacterium]